ncbi:hypothetical protein [Mycobacterium tuberculosis]|nr:hypothetical protein M943_13140 [Mycobacterium tuberculosis EAI5]AKR02369.1 hypothetical protein Mb1595_p2846 [Mycobacterium tuberculosis variant bovis]ESK75289.1 hypothetical protein O216_13875 [Mycobacterium tuberculosis variant bovis 04-303]EUB00304.1 hypothetical protein Z030_13635 [Mycobacterium tuberculosis INS_XDR]EUB02886.1 hypothetical protein Z028_13645 [Mycobacterium tuberculosis INS_MDR]EUB03826.1 hypothetical protein Z029_13600 [Mycobacterium tuberculosis INS_SEN]
MQPVHRATDRHHVDGRPVVGAGRGLALPVGAAGSAHRIAHLG